MPSNRKPSNESEESAEERTKRFTEALEKWAASMPFAAYEPYATFSTNTNSIFLNRDGKRIHRDTEDPDVESIWKVGEAAYKIINPRGLEEFRSRHDEFKETVNLWRDFLGELAGSGNLVDQHGNCISVEAAAFNDREASEILPMAWEVIERAKTFSVVVTDELRRDAASF